MIKLSPLDKYNQDLTRDDFLHDEAQENAVKNLQRLYEDLQNKPLPTDYELKHHTLKYGIVPNQRQLDKKMYQ